MSYGADLDDEIPGYMRPPWDEEGDSMAAITAGSNVLRLPPPINPGKEKARLMKEIANPPPGKHRVVVQQDPKVSYPELYLEVYVHGPPADCVGFPEMFARAACNRAESPDAADLVVFAGGSDVDPVFYNENPHPKTFPNEARDQSDIRLYAECIEKGIPMLGVCRGAQFLHVMNGGKLIQDIDGHYGDHPIVDSLTGVTIGKASSVHHQAVLLPESSDFTLLASVRKSQTRWLNDKVKQTGPMTDIEAFFYRNSCCLGVQGHPEYRGYPFFTAWVLKKIEQHIIHNTDAGWVGGRRRIMPELVKLRQEGGLIVEPLISEAE